MKTIKIILLFISLFSIPSLYSKSMDLNGIISVKASTFQNESHKPEFTIDGDRSTRWSSDFADQQWLEYDFKHEVVLTGLSLFWETAFAKEYDILVSKDRKSWTTVFKTREGDGRSDHIKFASPRQIRYLKINFIKRGTEWGYSLWEVLFKTDKEPAGLGRRPTKQNPDAPMDDNKFLSEISEYSFRYFINEIGADNELIQDRMKDKKTFSTMAVGFHLPVLCAGAERGWISREEAATRTLRALRSFDSMKKFHGFFGHYYDIQNGKVLPLMSKMDDGADISETGFMMMGILTSMEYFNKENALEKEIRTLAQRLYENVEWDFMLKDKNGNTLKTLSWHWSPQFGFEIGQRIKSTMEISSMVTYLLAIASPTHPIPQENWDEGWASSYKFGNYMGFDFVQCPPLFAQQYPQVWLDFRFMKDRYANYFRSSTSSVLLNRKFCLETLYPKQDLWGLTFCDGPYGYGIYGFPPMVGAVIEDAAIAPTGAGASIIFTPKESISSMRYMYDNYKDRLWGKYGFYDAFSIQEDWFDEDYLAIDQGPITLMIENYISGFVWKYAMKNRYIRTGLDKAGFVAVIDDFEKSPFESYAKWSSANHHTSHS